MIVVAIVLFLTSATFSQIYAPLDQVRVTIVGEVGDLGRDSKELDGVQFFSISQLNGGYLQLGFFQGNAVMTLAQILLGDAAARRETVTVTFMRTGITPKVVPEVASTPTAPPLDPNHIVDPASGHVRLKPRWRPGFLPRPAHEAEIFFVAWVVGCLGLCGYFLRRGFRREGAR